VVDEHVPAATVAEHLEVAGVLVDIQDDADVMLGDRLLEVAHGRRVHDRERTVAQQCARPRGVSGQHDDGQVCARWASGLYHCRIWYMLTSPSAK
jgi:hypothetical protein